MRVKYKDKTSREERTVATLSEDMKRNPGNYLQPKIEQEKFTGKRKIDQQFFNKYGNIYNKKNKRDIYIENTEEVKDTTPSWDQVNKEIDEHYWKSKYTTQYATNWRPGVKSCKACSAYSLSRDAILCWYCNNVI